MSWGLVLGSAAVGALVAALVNVIGGWITKRMELERQDMEMAFKLTDLRHRQLTAVQDWAIKEGNTVAIEFWDPLMTVIHYRRGMEEFRKTGRWAQGEEGLQRARERK